MSDEPRWRRYLRFHRPDHLGDFNDEMRDHLQSIIDGLMASGWSHDDASREAHRRFGDLRSVRTSVARVDASAARWQRVSAWLDSVRQDMVFAVRQLRRAPVFSAVAAISIGLGVGLNVTIFSVMNGLLLRPLPGVETTGLRRLYVNHHGAFQWQDFAWFRDRATLLQSMVGEWLLPVSMETAGTPERIVGATATRGFFQTLGVRMAVGRAFDVDERESGELVTVLAYKTWHDRFNADPAIVGKSIRLAGRSFTIVGVAAPEFASSVFGWSPALWVPLASIEAINGTRLADYNGSSSVIGRLKPGTSQGAVEAQLASLAKQRLALDTARFAQFTVRLEHVRGVGAEFRAVIAIATGFLLTMVILVLTIACANVANLLLARGEARRTEIGVRLALGAGKARLIRQFLTESLMLALVGATLGLAGAFALIRVIVRLLPVAPEVSLDFRPDGQVFAYAAVVCIASAVLFGLWPAMRATSPALTGFLREGSTAGGRRSRARGLLVGGQVALCVVLLGVTALLSGSFVRSRAVDPGITPAGVFDVQLDLGQRRASADGLALFDRIAERLRAMPGVSSVALADLAPLSGSNMETRAIPEGMSATDRASTPRAYFNVVTPSYFTTLGIRLIRGREFQRTDAPGTPMVAVINETAARRWWPEGDAIGKRFRWGGTDGDLIEVVGVARDAKYNSYGEDPTPFVYLPLAQHYRSQMIAHVRVTGATGAVTTRSLSEAVRGVDASLAPPTIKPLSDEIAFALLPSRIGASLLGAFGLVALIIAASGIYGVMSYMVSRRTREIGIRTALGASRNAVVRLILRDGMRTVAIGTATGMVLCIALGAALSHALYGISAGDPVMLLGAPGVLALVALIACWLPARRAARISPMTAMRDE